MESCPRMTSHTLWRQVPCASHVSSSSGRARFGSGVSWGDRARLGAASCLGMPCCVARFSLAGLCVTVAPATFTRVGGGRSVEAAVSVRRCLQWRCFTGSGSVPGRRAGWCCTRAWALAVVCPFAGASDCCLVRLTGVPTGGETTSSARLLLRIRLGALAPWVRSAWPVASASASVEGLRGRCRLLGVAVLLSGMTNFTSADACSVCSCLRRLGLLQSKGSLPSLGRRLRRRGCGPSAVPATGDVTWVGCCSRDGSSAVTAAIGVAGVDSGVAFTRVYSHMYGLCPRVAA